MKITQEQIEQMAKADSESYQSNNAYLRGFTACQKLAEEEIAELKNRVDTIHTDKEYLELHSKLSALQTEREKAEREIAHILENWKTDNEIRNDYQNGLRGKIHALQTQLDKAEVALEYYADDTTWRYAHIDAETMKAPYNNDVGDKARAYFDEKKMGEV